MDSVLIAVPTFDSIEPQTFKSIYGLFRPQDTNIMFDFIQGYDVSRARNKLVEEALKYNFTYIFFIDSDIVLPSHALSMLLYADKDIIFGWYPRKRTTMGQTELFELGQKDFTDTNNVRIRDITGEEPVKIKGGGFGCALVKTSVFSKLGDGCWFKYVEYSPASVLSEDNYFCCMASNAGFDIWYHPQVRCGHVSKVVL